MSSCNYNHLIIDEMPETHTGEKTISTMNAVDK